MQTWVVRIYDTQDNIVDEYLIENRTENEAVKEAESDSVVLQNDSWTLTEVKKDEANQPTERGSL